MSMIAIPPRLDRRDFLAATLGGVLAAECLSADTTAVAQTGAIAPAPIIKSFPTVERIRGSDPAMWQLVDLINDERTKQKLPAIPLSPRLTAVAYLHAKDLAEKQPHVAHGSLHSWSDDRRWRGGAYKPDDKATFPIMWDKPQEIAGYPAAGFEICVSGAKDMPMAMTTWAKSTAHYSVILNRGIWADRRWQWQAVGAAMYQGFACAWFGNLADA